MDGLKLSKWERKFTEQIANVRIEYDAFFISKKLEEYYSLSINATSEQLELQVSDELPKVLKDRLVNLLISTKPEDSV